MPPSIKKPRTSPRKQVRPFKKCPHCALLNRTKCKHRRSIEKYFGTDFQFPNKQGLFMDAVLKFKRERIVEIAIKADNYIINFFKQVATSFKGLKDYSFLEEWFIRRLEEEIYSLSIEKEVIDLTTEDDAKESIEEPFDEDGETVPEPTIEYQQEFLQSQ
ncbi:hypothetical protein C9374_010598 [Naegleria lovaniensis]|uniref:Uncharacterized protein n=1 Tax=Naegleria lovaniensis TaxID=51637 RepID=A0AA88GHB0_NAELO|nr:uncharacterized protein C9374_010598 [Naegleria lovaniensis]KAG2374579.1 hypothetical protein C9374_010598 [Naegleria lovaniensis]